LRLKGNEKMRDGAFVAHAILVGPGYMTPFADALTDEEIAIITTFVRNAWGNDYGPMTAEEVAQLRQ
jgi:mono/diheme cytochrome c family protein